MSVIVTQLRRAEHGELEANLTVDGRTFPVQRRWGSWGTVPDSDGRYKHLPFHLAAELQKRARSFERRET